MSGRRNKRNRQQQRDAGVVDGAQSYPNDLIRQSETLRYIYSLFRRYSGYTCISVSRPQKHPDGDIVILTAHTEVPAMTESGLYVSATRNSHIELRRTTNNNFQGLICDRVGNVVVGDAYANTELAEQE